MDELKSLREQKERIEQEQSHRFEKLDQFDQKTWLRRWIEFNGEIPCA